MMIDEIFNKCYAKYYKLITGYDHISINYNCGTFQYKSRKATNIEIELAFTLMSKLQIEIKLS